MTASGAAPASGEPLELATLREWGRRYSRWGRWGPDDELGALNFITSDRVLAATRLPRLGQVISCAWPFDAGASAAAGVAHGPIADRSVEPPRGAPRGGAVWEGLSGVSYEGRCYNDREPASLPPGGARGASIDRLRDGVVGRGVLLDLPRHRGIPWLEDGAGVEPGELDACAEASGVTVETGDILLVRTGRMTRGFAVGAWGGYAGGPAPGLSARCARWLHERQVAAVAADSWCVEVVPHEVEGCAMPLHQLAVRDLGVLLGESFYLDRLGEACAQDGRYAFLFAAAPQGGEGADRAPINPLAIK